MLTLLVNRRLNADRHPATGRTISGKKASETQYKHPPLRHLAGVYNAPERLLQVWSGKISVFDGPLNLGTLGGQTRFSVDRMLTVPAFTALQHATRSGRSDTALATSPQYDFRSSHSDLRGFSS